MLSVRKEELLSEGLMGIVMVAMGAGNFFSERDLITGAILGIYIFLWIATFLYKKHCGREPWDELTKENYAKARKFTLHFIEIALLICIMLCIIFHPSIMITAGMMMLICGIIKLIQTGAFLYYDSHSAYM